MAQVQASAQRAVTANESIELIRCLLRVSVFHVTALRGLFPDEYYREVNMRNLEGMAIKVLNPVDDESKRLIDWIDGGVFEAVKKGYLKSLLFGISSNAEGTALMEEYVYNFSYGPNGALAIKVESTGANGAAEIEVPTSSGGKNQSTPAAVKYQVTRLMRMLVGLCKTLEKVPKERYLFCRLSYYDHTPEDYEPSFFRSLDAADSGRFSHFSRRPFTMHVGNVVTSHHQCSLRVKSILDACDDEGDGGDEEEYQDEISDLPEEELQAAAPPRQRAQDDLNDLMTEPQDHVTAPQAMPPLADENRQDPDVVESLNQGFGGKENDVPLCPEATAAKERNDLTAGMNGLAVGKKRAPREPASQNFPAYSQGQESDTTMSPSKGTVPTGGRCSSKRAHDAEVDAPNLPFQASQEQMNVFYDASQQSGLKPAKRSKASVVAEPIHQTGAKKKTVTANASPKTTPAGGRTRLGRMRC